MRFIVSFCLTIAAIIGALWTADHFGLSVWHTAILAGVFAGASVLVEAPLVKIVQRLRTFILATQKP